MSADPTAAPNLPADLASHCLAITEQAPLPMATVDGATHIVRYANPAFCTLMGKPKEQLLGKPLSELLPEKDECVSLLNRVFRTGKPESHTEEEKSSPHPVFWSYTVWPANAGEGLVGIMIQVTETAKFHGETVAMNQALLLSSLRQHELAEAAEKLNARQRAEIIAREQIALDLSEAARELAEKARLLDLTEDAIIVRNVDGRISYWNHGAEVLYGWSSEEALGKISHALLRTEFPFSMTEEQLTEELHRNGRWTGELGHTTRDGRRIAVLVRKTLDRDSDGKPTAVLQTLTDISARKHAQEKLREAKETAETANQSKDRFLAVLSHELRTPLTPVLMAVAALEHDPELRRDVREDMVMIKRNIELEVKFIDDLLDVSRIGSGKVPLHIAPLDLNAAVREVCAGLRSQLLEQRVRLEMELSADIGLIAADAVRLQQVLSNVLRNAVKFTPEQGTIRVSSARLGPARCEVRVCDSGIGIPPEMLPHIFDAFEQGDARVTRQFGGLGLGLTIAKALVELHGGSIRAESAGSGQGATFIIELPGEQPASESATPPAVPDGELPGRLRLLIVEDHDDTARALRRLMTKAGYAVSIASNVVTALALAARETFDLLISDLGLPDGTGYDVMTGLQKIQPLPGIAMSGYGMEDDVRRSREAGFGAHLVKPVEVPKLIAAIRQVMKPKP